MPKIRIEADFTWRDRVMIITNPEDKIIGVITELKCSENEVQYLVASGTDEKYCFAQELELLEPLKKEDKK